ncbi:sulfite exporter TauE/SafE family protein [Rubripirellula amarantea]|uniref:sulfite exporter TauE/SafE family protein n=1 Tax=Rubripirellula amarantea TaxID=2527999 RepID=UPI0011B46C60|nr:sulfite exporter TauE/SafE family protein [Rubripirellula amarantea]
MAFGIAIFTASLLGSLHCVGMCGPFALWATGTDKRASVIGAYHFGRLTTYLSAGLAAGLIGSTLTITGEVAGFQSLAAKIAGTTLVVVGLTQLIGRYRAYHRTTDSTEGPKPSKIAGYLHAAKPLIASQGPVGRAYLGGLLTTWLPCGWLYLFVLVAGGTGNVVSSLVVMTAFWIGTLPALSGLILGVHTLSDRFRSLIPIATSVLLILTGMYTATGRATADLTQMNPDAIVRGVNADPSAATLEKLCDEPLPCCQCGQHAKTSDD